MESEDEIQDHAVNVVDSIIADIQEAYWTSVREELKKILAENPTLWANATNIEDDFLDMMIAMMKEEAAKNEVVLDA